jgi:hypothetical protein
MTVIIFIFLGLFIGLGHATPPPAAPGDVTITFTIPANQIVEFRAAFLAYMPNSQTDEDGVKLYSDKQWFKVKLQGHLDKILANGNKIRNKEVPVYVTDPNAFTVTVQ